MEEQEVAEMWIGSMEGQGDAERITLCGSTETDSPVSRTAYCNISRHFAAKGVNMDAFRLITFAILLGSLISFIFGAW
jgi:hypothetical protein